MKTLPSVIVITGPTASGKSDIAVELAIKHGGEIISADSRQVYKGLTIGTGKITPQEMKGILHHLIDICDPLEKYTVKDFQNDATTKIHEIIERKSLPILCGGSGQWISSLIEGHKFHDVNENIERRKELERLSLEDLSKTLENLDPSYFKKIDKNNPRRLIRAIEIAEQHGMIPPLHFDPLPYNFTTCVICPARDVLRKKISLRLDQRLQAGMIDESKQLLKDGLITHDRMEELGLEYRWMSRFLSNQVDYETMREMLFFDIWHYAKRQITWWKKKTNTIWIDPLNHDSISTFIQGD